MKKSPIRTYILVLNSVPLAIIAIAGLILLSMPGAGNLIWPVVTKLLAVLAWTGFLSLAVLAFPEGTGKLSMLTGMAALVVSLKALIGSMLPGIRVFKAAGTLDLFGLKLDAFAQLYSITLIIIFLVLWAVAVIYYSMAVGPSVGGESEPASAR